MVYSPSTLDNTSPQGEVVMARLVNMRKSGVHSQLQTMSPGLNCGPDAHFKKHTDRMKGRNPRKADFMIDEIMKLNRESKVFAHDPIDWADTAMKCKMTRSPRGADEIYSTGFKTIWILSVPQHIDSKCITIQNVARQQACSGMWTAKIPPSKLLFIQMVKVDGDKFKY